MKTINKKISSNPNGYGELTFEGILDLIKDIRLHEPKRFLDIGSGYGYISRMVRDAVKIPSVGIEINKKRYEACKIVHAYANKHGAVPATLDYFNYDIYKHNHHIRKASYIFSNSCLFDQDFPHFVVENMQPGAVFVTNSTYTKPHSNILLGVTWKKELYKFKKIIKE